MTNYNDYNVISLPEERNKKVLSWCSLREV